MQIDPYKITGRIYDESAPGGMREVVHDEHPDFWTVREFVTDGTSSGWRHLVDTPTEIEALEYVSDLH